LTTHEVAVWFRVVVAIAVRPRLWATALRQFARAVPRGWWRRPPFLPVPDASYLRYRIETAYGPRGEPRGAELVSYLEWCRSTARARVGAGRA
jgi:hypothetical protein